MLCVNLTEVRNKFCFCFSLEIHTTDLCISDRIARESERERKSELYPFRLVLDERASARLKLAEYTRKEKKSS